MRTIRCIEHTGKMKFITPFVGSRFTSARPPASPSPMAAPRSTSPRSSQSPRDEAIQKNRKWKIRNNRYTKLKDAVSERVTCQQIGYASKAE